MRHKTLKAESAEYWNFSWAEMGLYDDKANVDLILDKSGAEKIFYIGWSQGGAQLIYALAHKEEEYFADRMYKAVFMAPCMGFAPTTDPAYQDYYKNTLFKFPSMGINSLFGGPNWKTNLQKICSMGQDACALVNCPECEPTGVIEQIHWMANAFVDRFQEFPENWPNGQYEAPLVDLGSIDKV